MNEFESYVNHNKLQAKIDEVGVRKALPELMTNATDKECVELRKSLGLYGVPISGSRE